MHDGLKKRPVGRPRKSSRIIAYQRPMTASKNPLSELTDKREDSVIVLDEVNDSDEDLGCADELVNEPAASSSVPKQRPRRYRTYSLQCTSFLNKFFSCSHQILLHLIIQYLIELIEI